MIINSPLARLTSEECWQESSEVVIVGSGVAGLRSALDLAEHYTVTVLTKGELRDSNTWRAQGGIAAVLRDDDSFESHRDDTLQAGGGLCDVPRVERLVREGPEEVRGLIEWGADFDRANGELEYTREGGHDARRVVHGRGDATGSLVVDTLVNRVRVHPRIQLLPRTMMLDLLTDGDRVYGITMLKEGEARIHWCRGLILASGGLGQVYRETTNHEVVTGDGMAAALRAGLKLQDVEFIQFHPTTLYVAGGPRFLISEAVRGEGALLRDINGERYMPEIHEDAELAPRDIVSRASLRRMIETEASHVLLDVSPVGEEVMGSHFPTISGVCEEVGINIPEEPIPVRPCAHYGMGGIPADLDGATSVRNLYCAGEVACTGVHGANRLASNSLLEGLVMGGNLVEEIDSNGLPELQLSEVKFDGPVVDELAINLNDLRQSLQSVMDRDAGILREGSGLERTRRQIEDWLKRLNGHGVTGIQSAETMNLLLLGRAIVESAMQREESRGSHFREDYPEPRESWRDHSRISWDGEEWDHSRKNVEEA